ncbi:MAG: tRNA (guanosine(37)-N1)-methyltransferase TrmD [Myxococcota bacterium]|jgi:tRNA (guanine37-N1)-methyltransferase|nr:tRNA (guanosine(37)-N1)-methyltransferase TrmD [Myxococcota bacterium]
MADLEIDLLTIFPGLFDAFLDESFVGMARERGLARIAAHDLREWTDDRHRTVDDAPYGGGPGMLMKPEPLIAGIEALAGPKGPEREARVVLLSPQGRCLDQGWLEEAARHQRWVIVCGRYEGVDQRAIDLAIDEEISLGDYVLCGGEIPAMVLVEGMVRLLPGLLGNAESVAKESFTQEILEGPQYTRPPIFRDLEVPEILRSGHHAEIARWRRERALEWTRLRRPDLLERKLERTDPPPERNGPAEPSEDSE